MPTPKVIITRPARHALRLQEGLQQCGREVVMFALFDIVLNAETSQIDACLRNLSDYRLVIFVSPNAIDACFTRLASLDLAWPHEVAVGVMGEGSRQALASYGLHAENTHIFCPIHPERTDSETLLAVLDLSGLRGKKVLIIRGDSGRDFLADALQLQGVEVEQVAAYQRRIPAFDEEKQQRMRALLSQENDWVITSSAVLSTLLEWCCQIDVADATFNAVVKMQQQHLVLPHFRIAEVAKKLGFSHLTLTASGDEKLLLALQSDL
ncbi:MAG: uroporphyrinogen-III synthase [Burkholderiales bacterium]|nr:uroporphyrinogen-III synthase [Burkholderiales bacterium]